MNLPNITELMALRREGALARPQRGVPRGTREVPANAHWSKNEGLKFDLESIAEDLRYNTDQAWQVEAIAVLGEFGSEAHVSVLGSMILGQRPDLQVAAAYALASIGGQTAESYLLDTVSCTHFSSLVRLSALSSELDLLTGGLEAYRMASHRVPCPPKVLARLHSLKSDPVIGLSVISVLEMLGSGV